MEIILRSCFSLVLLIACWSRGSAQTALPSTRCSPESSVTSACVWTGDCDEPGCADKCIANRGTLQSWFVLLDRAAGEEFYSACPLLAYWVNHALAVQRGAGRRLLSENDSADQLRSNRMVRMPADGIPKLERAASRSLLNAFGDYSSPPPLSFFGDYDARDPSSDIGDYASPPSSFVFGDYDSPPPSSTSTGNVSADLPSNVCPTSVEIDEAAQGLAILASIFRQIFEADASGQPVPSDLENFSGILDRPNTFQWLTAFLEDPDRLAEYISNNCASKTIDDLESLQFTGWLEPDDYELLLEQDELSQVQCVDTFGAIDDFLRNYQSVLFACNPPFGLTPDCFTVLGHYIVTSPTCATAYARMFNVTDATPLASIAANVNNIQDACSAVTTEAECFAADTPVLDTIDDLHDDIPVVWPLDIVVTTPPGPTPPTEPVCFGCPEDVAQEPEAALPSGDPLVPDILPAPTDAPMPTAPPIREADPEGRDTEGGPGGVDDNPPVPPTLTTFESGAAPVAISAIATAAVLLLVLLL
eukprot:jgi/Ulvmu1/10453/UM063_0008.1